MIKRETVFTNILHTFSGQTVAMVLGFATHAYLARVLGVENYGILGFATSVVSYFGVLASLGADVWASRAIARVGAIPIVITGHIVSLRLALSFVSASLLFILLLIWNQPQIVNSVILLQAIGFFIAAITLDFSFQGLEKLNVPAVRQILAASLSFAGMIILMPFLGTVFWAALIFQCSMFLAAMYSYLYFRNKIGIITLKVQKKEWGKIIRKSAPFAITSIVIGIYFSIDVVIIGIFLGKYEVGLYVAAGKVYALGLAVIGMFNKVFFPLLSRLLDDKLKRIEASSNYAKTVIFITCLISAGGFLLAPEILVLLFGENYIGAELVLRYFMLNLAVASVVEVYHLQMAAWNHERIQMFIMIIGALSNLIMNMIFIPKFGIEAAALTTIASTFIVLVFTFIMLKRCGRELHKFIICANWLLFLAIITGFFYLNSKLLTLEQLDLANFTIKSLVIVSVYCLFGGICRIFKPIETLRYFRRAI